MWLLALLIIVNIYLLTQTGKHHVTSNGEKWTIYGTMGCGWTRKQLDYMKKAGSLMNLLIVIKVVVREWMPSQPPLILMVKRLLVTKSFKHP